MGSQNPRTDPRLHSTVRDDESSMDGASLKIGSKSFTEEALLAAITKIEPGNLKYEIDFRSVYQTLIRDWLQGDAATVLGATYPELPFINKA
jgi:hypothetical protein